MLYSLQLQSPNGEHLQTSGSNTEISSSTIATAVTDAAIIDAAVTGADVCTDVGSTVSTTTAVTSSSAKQDRLMAALVEASQANKQQVHRSSNATTQT
jgi:hypothetical protein